MKTIKKLLRYLAVSLVVRIALMEWIALSVLLALGVVKEIEPDINNSDELFTYYTAFLLWYIQVNREEILRILKVFEGYTKRGLNVYIRAP